MAMVYTQEKYLDNAPMYDETHPVQIKKPKVIPMPFIKDAPGSKDKVIVTEDWYVKTKKKKLAKRAKEKREYQIEMMQLIGEKEILKSKLSKLNSSKKKDMKRIIAINVKIKDIEAELKMLQEESGINIEEIDKGTKLGRFVNRIKRGIKKQVKKVKNWFKDNSELVSGIATVVIPVIVALVAKKFLGFLV